MSRYSTEGGEMAWRVYTAVLLLGVVLHQEANSEVLHGECGAQDAAHIYPRHKREAEEVFSSESESLLSSKRRTIELAVICDYTCNRKMREKTINVASLLDGIIRDVDKRMSGVYISVAVMWMEIWSLKDQIKITNSMTEVMAEMQYYRLRTVDAQWTDATLLITGEHMLSDTGNRLTGTFNLAAVCTRSEAVGVIPFDLQPVGHLAQTIAHELSHGLGMRHDVAGCCTVGERNCVMAPALNAFQVENFIYSDCSKRDYDIFLGFQQSICLENVPKKGYDSGGIKCGNGIWDEGEECDCGGGCLHGCCNCCSPSCTLKPGAQCHLGDCCDTNTCLFVGAGEVCGISQDEICDPSDVCTGSSHNCNVNVTEDGRLCSDGAGEEGYCVEGWCNTRSNQCQTAWKTGYVEADEVCYKAAVTSPSSLAHCGITGQNAYLPCTNSNESFYECGLLQCKNLGPAEGVINPYNYYRRPTYNYNIPDHQCLSLSHGEWEPIQGPLMVASGTPCGQGRACWGTQCLEKDSAFINMKNESSPPIGIIQAKCGNGHVEDGEDCDCGPKQCDCCNSQTCMLQQKGVPCLSDECKACNGLATQCGSSPVRDYSKCEAGLGNCVAGKCISLNTACKKYFGINAEAAMELFSGNAERADSQHNGGGYILKHAASGAWQNQMKEFFKAEGDGRCGLLLCRTSETAVVRHNNKTAQSTTFSMTDHKDVRISYYNAETTRDGPELYYKYFPVLTDDGTPCFKNGKEGVCSSRNLKLDEDNWNWYWISKCSV